MKTTVRTLRRIVKEELEQLTLPGVSMGPTGQQAWDEAWADLQQARRAMNAALFDDDDVEYAIAKKELAAAQSRFDAINDASEEDTAETERVYGSGGLGT